MGWRGALPHERRAPTLDAVHAVAVGLPRVERAHLCHRRRPGGEPRPGVYFFSLEAANPVAVRVARNLFRLPYFDARMSLIETEHAIRYRSHRTHRGAPPADFAATYRPISHGYRSHTRFPGPLADRTLLPVHGGSRQGRVLRGEIHHEPWPLQLAEAAIATNTMAAASGIELPSMTPLLHFARRLDVVGLATAQRHLNERPAMTHCHLGFPVKVLGAPLRSHDSRRWQNQPHLSVSLAYVRDVFEYLQRRDIRFYRLAGQLAPYLTHPALPQFHRQLEECSVELAAIGRPGAAAAPAPDPAPGPLCAVEQPGPGAGGALAGGTGDGGGAAGRDGAGGGSR